ncbi:MAG TPA: hypothetical protein DIS90_08595, partial [Cytophagales bacterium]|nr:hypothetical protein [Cytophagales bacterium]
MKPGKMIFGDAKEHDVTISYQMPELFKNPQNKFIISMDGGEPYAHSGGIEAFMVEGNTWALRNVPVKTEGYAAGARQFVILTRQGAIEQYSYIYYGKPSDESNMAYNNLFKNRLRIINHKVSTNEFVEGVLTEEKLKEWITDSPEVMEDFKKAEAQANAEQERQAKSAGATKPEAPKKKGLMGALENAANKDAEQKQAAAVNVDLNRIINNYNAWYDQQHPGKIRYYFSSSTSWVPLSKPAKTQSEIKAENAARKEALFAGRTATPSPDVASAKDNMPVKKETFAAKMDRIKADGNKIGVVLYLKPVMVPKAAAPSSSMMMSEAMPGNSIPIEGEYMDESLQALGENFAAEINAALGTTDIELIDINKMPYRDSKFGRLDDWWATKYKVVFAYTVDPRLKASHEEIEGKQKFAASLNMVNSLVVTEYIGGPGATKQDFLAQIINMGSFVTPTYAQDEDMADVQEIYEKILEKLGTPMVDKINSERADAVTKLVEKKL